jgi:cation diffusion facilitator CzcD-associated flavoprotein CzcO
LRAALTPQFAPGCKRLLLADDYYPALQRADVDLVTEPIVRVGADGIVTADGRSHPLDVLIFATGFHATDVAIADRLYDADGVALGKRWEDTGMQALRGTTVPGYPNLFLVLGPNTGLGHTSMLYMIESQVAYISSAIRASAGRGLTELTPRADVTARYNQRLRRKLSRSVWNTGGCRSWYLDAQGRNPTMWPDFTFRFRRATRRVDLSEYEVA